MEQNLKAVLAATGAILPLEMEQPLVLKKRLDDLLTLHCLQPQQSAPDAETEATKIEPMQVDVQKNSPEEDSLPEEPLAVDVSLASGDHANEQQREQ